jgi:hypothetical protein
MAKGERIEFCIVGNSDQAIVALGERIMTLKSGYMAGATLGNKVTSFPYRELSSISVTTTALSGVIEIIPVGTDAGKQAGVWDRGKDDPYRLPNCIVFVTPQLQEYQPYLERLRAKIAESRSANPLADVARAGNLLVSELERLAGLLEKGHISANEFELLKRRLLAPGGEIASSQPASNAAGEKSSNASAAYIHVGGLTGKGVKVNRKCWRAEVIITVHDSNHRAVGGVTVTGVWSTGGDTTCATDANGTGRLTSADLDNSIRSTTFTPSNLTENTYAYHGLGNHPPSVTVSRP